MGELSARGLRADEYDDFFGVFSAAFLDDSLAASSEAYEDVFRAEFAHGVFDGDEMIGAAGRLEQEITVPGPAQCPLAAITAVGVKPGHRRRGVLTSLMREQLGALHDDGMPVAALYASEAGIYGRFGYGLASFESHLAVPRGAAFLSTVEVDGRRVREVGREQALEFARSLYPAVAAANPGWLSRSDGSWEARVLDSPNARGDVSAPRFAVHPDGYAIYRPKREWTSRGPAYQLHVAELVAATPQAYAALWRYLLDIDLVAEVVWRKAAIDEPVLGMLVNPRAVDREVLDGLWVRLVDLDRALMARRYAAPVDVVFDVTDRFCPWNEGRWRLRADGAGSATATRTENAGEISLDVAALAAAYLGGTTLAALARTGRVVEREPGALLAASRAFATDFAPHCQEGF
ncbi:GNAT family N-acetyltransferase [Saccharopolyspora sp. WRP15-2]|uniref:GNAT family N-acetyltransferase n=1 Tax=Saccharopolyspora oryzae TaxID=2997343 RepID=A0ABT4UZZ9_9PSEU|nr:GNAT family N-acetyltransferase [Saccharopolyspora oryzae]MDA3626761.1 GNAT family N-acetyltransferase [Saccharopolyspora oryzae]